MVAVVRASLDRTKVVDAPRLNRLGLQVGRTLAATARVRLARWSSPPEVRDSIAALRSDGFAAVTGLFAPEELDEMAEVARRVNAADGVAHFTVSQGANTQHGTWRTDVPEADRAVLDRFFLHPRVLALASAAERLEVEPGAGRCTIQRLVQAEGEPDLESEIHSDTFHPTHKLWLYLSDVTEEDGPLVYYPRSQRLSLRLLRGVRAGSIDPTRASRAIDEDEIAARGLEPKIFTCPRGTVVLANTFGYHGRVQGHVPGERLALHLELRPHPFRRPRSMPVDRSSAAPASAPA